MGNWSQVDQVAGKDAMAWGLTYLGLWKVGHHVHMAL